MSDKLVKTFAYDLRNTICIQFSISFFSCRTETSKSDRTYQQTDTGNCKMEEGFTDKIDAARGSATIADTRAETRKQTNTSPLGIAPEGSRKSPVMDVPARIPVTDGKNTPNTVMKLLSPFASVWKAGAKFSRKRAEE